MADSLSDLNECLGSHNCGDNARCKNTMGSFNCDCLQGFQGNGMTCLDVDECSDSVDNCSPHAYCNNTLGAYNCTCFSGFEGDGKACRDVDECKVMLHQCNKHAFCINNGVLTIAAALMVTKETVGTARM